ncbi:hypothetical protein ACS0TY_013074 [Phlomoides rotata]
MKLKPPPPPPPPHLLSAPRDPAPPLFTEDQSGTEEHRGGEEKTAGVEEHRGRRRGAPRPLNSGKVVAIGSGLRDKSGNNIPVAVKEGDTFLLPDYGGTQVKLGEKE